MRVSSYFASAIAAFAAFASAQNPFTYPVNGDTIQAGEVVNLKWTPSTQGTVSLFRRSGNPGALSDPIPIATNITNSGSYSWTVPSSITAGSDYAVEIIDDSNQNIYNYTPQFTINSSNTVTSAASSATMTSMSTAMSTEMSTTDVSSSMSMTGSMTSSASSSMRTSSGMSSATSSSMMAAGTILPVDENAGNVVQNSGIAAVLAMAGVIAML